MTERPSHETSPPFSREEVAHIREAVLTPGAAVECPRCSSPLTIEAVAGEVQGAGWWIHCASCRRNLVARTSTRSWLAATEPEGVVTVTKGAGLSRRPDLSERRQFRLKPKVHFQDVAWYRDEGVFAGEVLTDRVATVRLFAPEGAPEPRYIDVPSHWVKPARG